MTDWPALVTAAAGLVTACGWTYSQVRVRRTVNATNELGRATHESVGSANGANLQELVRGLTKLETYTHKSVHELRGHIGVATAVAPVILDRLDTLDARVAELTDRQHTGRADDDDDRPPPITQ